MGVFTPRKPGHVDQHTASQVPGAVDWTSVSTGPGHPVSCGVSGAPGARTVGGGNEQRLTPSAVRKPVLTARVRACKSLHHASPGSPGTPSDFSFRRSQASPGLSACPRTAGACAVTSVCLSARTREGAAPFGLQLVQDTAPCTGRGGGHVRTRVSGSVRRASGLRKERALRKAPVRPV